MSFEIKRVYAITNEAGEVVTTLTYKPRKKELAQLISRLERKAKDEAEPKLCPDKSKRVAPVGQHWVMNMMSRKWVLEACGTPYTASVQSETYWCS